MKRHIFAFIRYFIILVVLTLIYIFNNHAVTLTFLIFAILLPITSMILFLFNRDSCEVSLEFMQYLTSRNTPTNLIFHLKNNSYYPHSKVRLQFIMQNGIQENDFIQEIVLFLGPKKEETYDFPITFSFCGVYHAELLRVDTSELFDFFGYHKNMKMLSDIVVLPSTIDLSEAVYAFSGQNQDDDIVEAQAKGDDHSEIFEIREYASGDRLQTIHWKLSAKNEQLFVKEFADLTGEMFQIYLELAYSDNKQMDAFYDLFWSITNYFCSMKMTFSVCYVSNDEEFHRCFIQYPEDITNLIVHLYYEKVNQKKTVSIEEIAAKEESSKTYLLLTNLVRSKSQGMTLMITNRNIARLYKYSK